MNQGPWTLYVHDAHRNDTIFQMHEISRWSCFLLLLTWLGQRDQSLSTPLLAPDAQEGNCWVCKLQGSLFSHQTPLCSWGILSILEFWFLILLWEMRGLAQVCVFRCSQWDIITSNGDNETFQDVIKHESINKKKPITFICFNYSKDTLFLNKKCLFFLRYSNSSI